MVCDGRTKEDYRLDYLFIKNCVWALNGDGGKGEALSLKDGINNQK